jgi:hypothetical protein
MPYAADPRAALEDSDIVVAGAVQHYRGGDTAEAAADYGN